MHYLNVVLTVREEHAAAANEIEGLLAQAAAMSRQEPGCLRFEVYHCTTDPKVFLLCEHWESEQHWKDHREREAVQTIYIPKVLSRADRIAYACSLIDGGKAKS